MIKKFMKKAGAAILTMALLLGIMPLIEVSAAAYNSDNISVDTILSAGDVINYGGSYGVKVVYSGADDQYIAEGRRFISGSYTIEEKGYQGKTISKWKVTKSDMETEGNGSRTRMIRLKEVATYTAELTTTDLKGATASLSKTSGIAADDEVTLTITPESGKTFSQAPTVSATGATAGTVTAGDNGAYTCTLSSFTGAAAITVTGEATGSETAADYKLSDLHQGDTVSAGKIIMNDSGASCTISYFPAQGSDTFDDTTIYNGQTETVGSYTNNDGVSVTTWKVDILTDNGILWLREIATFKAELTVTDLKGATAGLTKTSGITANEEVMLMITPESGKTFSQAPTVTATGATAGTVTAGDDGVYTCTLSSFTGDAAITVTGEATAATDSKPAITTANSTHQIGAGKDMTFTCAGALEDFLGIYIDGSLVDKSNYTVKSGSTILTLKSSYLDTLSAGKHTLKFQYKDNVSAETSFTIMPKAAANNANGGTTSTAANTANKSASPKTGDTANTMLLLSLLALSAGAVVITGKRRKTAEDK